MSPDTISHLITAVTFIVAVFGVFGLPALAVVIIKFLKFKERELALDMEYRQKSQHQLLGFEQRMQIVEQRVQRMEDALTSLDHDVRDRLGIEASPATSLPSHPELVEGPAAPDARHQLSPGPSRTKAR